MEIKIAGSYPPEDLPVLDVLKFVLCLNGQDEQVLVLAPASEVHAEILPENTTLLGAGSVTNAGHASWGSESCRDELRFDRPDDAEQASRLLDMIQEKIRNWKRNVLA